MRLMSATNHWEAFEHVNDEIDYRHYDQNAEHHRPHEDPHEDVLSQAHLHSKYYF